MTSTFSCFFWNVRGLNDRARRNVVRETLLLHKPSIMCIQETKLSSFCNVLAIEILGPAFDYDFLPAVGGGWRDSPSLVQR
jgi:mRNA deadenylase 3'-5' endonuclease subunit Ccr4